MEPAQHADRVAIVLSAALCVACIALALHHPPPRQRYLFVDELVDRGVAHYAGDQLEVHGWVRAGSIVRFNGDAWLWLEKNQRAVLVHHRGPLPDTVKDQSEVIVYGEAIDNALEGHTVLAKCPSKYDSASPTKTTFQ